MPEVAWKSEQLRRCVRQEGAQAEGGLPDTAQGGPGFAAEERGQENWD